MRSLPRALAATTLLAMAGAVSAHAAPLFNLSYIAGTTAAAQTAFQEAADFWTSQFYDNVTVDLTVGTGALGSGILAQTSSAESSFNYAGFRNAMVANVSSATDTAAVASLPTAAPFNVYINRTSDNPNGSGSAIPYLDTTGPNNSTITMTNANAKALGLIPAPQVAPGCASNCDGFIEFSTGFTYDFNRNNGITAGQFDFVGLAIHEIGHALGFISGVDILDINSPNGSTFFPADDFTFVSPLDMFRCSSASAAAGAAIDFTDDSRTKNFSLDHCASSLGTFADGRLHGDGRQASHWKDNLGLGIMDPTAAAGELLTVTPLDLLAFDAIGWEEVPLPEPGTLVLSGVFLAGLAMTRRSRHR